MSTIFVPNKFLKIFVQPRNYFRIHRSRSCRFDLLLTTAALGGNSKTYGERIGPGGKVTDPVSRSGQTGRSPKHTTNTIPNSKSGRQPDQGWRGAAPNTQPTPFHNQKRGGSPIRADGAQPLGRAPSGKNGAGEEIRTLDLFLGKEAL